MTNDATVYRNGDLIDTGRGLDPSGSGHVPTHWERVTDYAHNAWDADKAASQTRTAQYILLDHGPHSDRIARDNCAACAVNRYSATEAPGYAGWLRVYVQARKPVPVQHFNTEVLEAYRENEGYYAAILRDIATYGITFTDKG